MHRGNVQITNEKLKKKKKKQNKAEVEENTQLTFWKEKSKDQGTN